jgi:hypothetical protein
MTATPATLANASHANASHGRPAREGPTRAQALALQREHKATHEEVIVGPAERLCARLGGDGVTWSIYRWDVNRGARLPRQSRLGTLSTRHRPTVERLLAALEPTGYELV